MKKIFFTIFLISFLLTGCVNYTELNDIGIVNAIGINKKNNFYEIQINMIIPKENGGKDLKAFKSSSHNLDEAINNLYEKSLRKIYLSHVDLLMLSDNLEKKDYDNIINLFFNRNDSRNTFSTAIIKDYTNENTSKILPENINSLLKVIGEKSGIVKIKQFDEIVQDILEFKYSYIPYLELKNEAKVLGYKEIYSNNKILSKEESLAYNFITNNIVSTNIISDEKINFHINTNMTKLMVENNTITININSNLNILSNDTNISEDTILKKKYAANLTNLLNNFIENNTQEYFYNLIKKYDYKYYKTHKNIKLKFKYEISSTINNNSTTIGGNNYEN